MAMLKNSDARYGVVARLFHWSIGLGILFMMAMGWYMADLPLDHPQKGPTYHLHKSLGTLLFGLAVLRLLWALVNRRPLFPPSMPGWQQKTALWAHHSLYALMLLMPLSGYAFSSTGGYGYPFFGLFDFPLVIPENKAYFDIGADVHEFFINVAVVVVGLHIIAALKHHFFDKDNVLRKML